MYKIGEFSRLSRVSVKTLRYYDEVGLLRPSEVDRWTGYRYYAAVQLPRLHRILALKDMGFSLEEIAALLDDDLAAEDLRGMFKAKRAETAAAAREAAERLARVEARLRLIENQEDPMSQNEVVIKKVEDVRCATIRETIPSYPEQGHLWGELMGHLTANNYKAGGPCFTLYHDECYKEKDVDAEVCEPIAAAVPEAGRVKVRVVPGAAQMACLIHKGPYTGLSAAYGIIMKWIEEHGYHIVGPDREVYLVAMDKAKDPADYVTEIQVPVTK